MLKIFLGTELTLLYLRQGRVKVTHWAHFPKIIDFDFWHVGQILATTIYKSSNIFYILAHDIKFLFKSKKKEQNFKKYS